MYFNLGLSDKDITNQLKDHYDPEVFGLRFTFSSDCFKFLNCL